MDRRNFIQCCSGIAGVSFTHSGKIPKRYFGANKDAVSILGFGAGDLYRLPQKDATDLAQTAHANGINLFDAAAAYGDGLSEERLGAALQGVARDDAFLISKTLGRTQQEAQKDLRSSLHRLRTDYLNVWMIHDLRNIYEWQSISSPRGALQAVHNAKAAGDAQYIGLSANRNPELVLKAIREYPFDVIMIPVTPDDAFVTKVLPEALNRNIGVIGIRVFDLPKKKKKNTAFVHKSINRALSYPIACAVTGCEDIKQLRENIGALR